MKYPSMDVLVVGAGPVGYMAAVTLARYGIDFRIIDKRAIASPDRSCIRSATLNTGDLSYNGYRQQAHGGSGPSARNRFLGA
jgi:2-polyprenyl-6-methoxyphenol hydroxylase-like FAD-dependent oxidoreductase